MNRRELLNRTASGLAGSLLVTVPTSDFSWTENKCTAPCNPGRAWKDNSVTRELQAAISPQVEKVKATKNLTSLSPEEWRLLSNNHAAWGDEHSRIGNLHLLDLYLQANQTILRNKAGNKEVDRMLKLGIHQCWIQDATVFAAIGKSMNVKWSPQDCLGLTVYGADAAILGMMFAGMGLEPLAILFGAIDVTIYLASIAYCS